MLEKFENSSYDLIMQIDGSWILKASQISVAKGTLKDVVAIMIKRYKFLMSEIEYAIEDMDIKGHNRAHFGMGKSFIFSDDFEGQKGVA